jgi:hypothetical protein
MQIEHYPTENLTFVKTDTFSLFLFNVAVPSGSTVAATLHEGHVDVDGDIILHGNVIENLDGVIVGSFGGLIGAFEQKLDVKTNDKITCVVEIN